jgi:hypothetical protein
MEKIERDSGVGLTSVLSRAVTHEQNLNRQLRERVLELEFELEEERKRTCKFWDVCRSTCTIKE